MRSNKGVLVTKIVASREMKMDSSLRKIDSSLLTLVMVPNGIPPIDGSSYKLMDSSVLREIIITWYDMIITYSQMQRTDKSSHHSSTISPVWLNVRSQTNWLWLRIPLLSWDIKKWCWRYLFEVRIWLCELMV